MAKERSEALAPMQARRSRLSGFTLVELLVVMGVIALLAGLLLPALAKAKSKGRATLCVNNHRQLGLAWFLYADDHGDRLPYNYGADGIRETVAARRYLNWVNNVMSWELDEENTNTVLATAGGLGPYCQRNAGAFQCPADAALSEIQKSSGWKRRVRSVSMNAMLGYAGAFMSGSVNTNNPGFRQFFRLSEIQPPSGIFTFVDEHPDSINDGYFLNRVEQREWVDLPASSHDGAATLMFADGHAEIHRWLHPGTKPPPRPDAAVLPMPIAEGQRSDFDWLAARTTTPLPLVVSGR